MISIAGISSFLSAHWMFCIVALWLVLDITVAVTPKRYQQTPWFGAVLRLFRLVSAHVHFDEPNVTLKIPVLNIPLRIGHRDVSPPNSP